ncbi:MAG: hypothetical protein KGL39_48635 [Patescibacteria group bacterium]|nr:hypothetical protein [Patescibacteria group bacterium]
MNKPPTFTLSDLLPTYDDDFNGVARQYEDEIFATLRCDFGDTPYTGNERVTSTGVRLREIKGGAL